MIKQLYPFFNKKNLTDFEKIRVVHTTD